MSPQINSTDPTSSPKITLEVRSWLSFSWEGNKKRHADMALLWMASFLPSVKSRPMTRLSEGTGSSFETLWSKFSLSQSYLFQVEYSPIFSQPHSYHLGHSGLTSWIFLHSFEIYLNPFSLSDTLNKFSWMGQRKMYPHHIPNQSIYFHACCRKPFLLIYLVSLRIMLRYSCF